MEKASSKIKYVLGLQHALAMFGATVLVPIQTGLDPSVALLCAGLGTLIFHLCTNGIVPVFLGSSFAFIGAISFILKEEGIAAVKTGIIATGIIYILMSLIIKSVGAEKIKSFFPPIVNGSIIIVIGLRLSPVAISMAGISNDYVDWSNLIIASVVVVTMILVTISGSSFFKLIPILISIVVGFICCIFMDVLIGTTFINISAIKDANWIGMSSSAVKTILTMPSFSSSAIIAIAPIAVVVFMEHIGDITTNGEVVGKNFFEKPGIHKTMLGDGLATLLAGFLGGPANTTYGENTGVLAITKIYDPKVLRIAAVYAIVLSFFGKFGALLQTMPVPIMGGVSIILFGMISSVGIRTLNEANIDFSNSRNLLITSVIFVLGTGIGEINIGTLSISGLAIAAFVGVLINKLLPKK
jgi:uracil permease